jgi:acetolactate synthase-1/2/3 large subunit
VGHAIERGRTAETVRRPSLKAVSARHSVIVPAGQAGAIQAAPANNVSDVLVQILVQHGVETAFGLVGGAVAPFCEALDRSSIRVVHARHEGGAAFAAIEESLASGRPAVVFCTTGPGITNALTGMIAARWEGAKVIFVSGLTSAPQRGRWAFQETSAYTMASTGLYASGSIFHYAVAVEDAAELEEVASRLSSGLGRPGGFVAHVALPIALQTARHSVMPRARVASVPPGCDADTIERCAKLLSEEPFVIWLGFGARGAAAEVRALAERSGAPVMASPRAKGIFPEDHPQYLGVTGLGGNEGLAEELRAARPVRALVLGSRLGEFTSFWAPELVPPEGLVHVDVDAEVFGAAYPKTKTLGVQSEIKSFVAALVAHWPTPQPRASARRPRGIRRSEPKLTRTTTVRPSALMGAIQRVVIDAHDALVMTEAGNSFLLGTHHLRFRKPGRYRVSSGFGSMGQAVAGVIGAALGTDRKAVAIVGDGAMLMQSEISTAVQYGIDAVWVVLNDARYGMIENGMRAQGFRPVETEIPVADFVAMARAVGADGVRVTSEDELDAALETAVTALGPFVVDVQIDRSEPAPPMGRVKSLILQGAKGDGIES